jgi:hypothetical protein
MKSKKIATTLKRTAATRTTDDTQNTLTEQTIILNHMLKGLTINCDQAVSEYGVNHLHCVIPKLEKFIKISRAEINKLHPKRKKIRTINSYWIDKHLIEVYASVEAREELRKLQTSTNIAKSRANDNKALIRLCSYCKRETVMLKLHEIYGQQAANDSN